MDFPLSSSVILVITVVLWFFWVAPYFLRSRLQHHGAVVELPAERFYAAPDQQVMTVLTMAAQQETAMDTRKTAASTGVPVSPAPAFRIRYGRCAIALAGLLALLTAMVSALLLAFGAVSGTLPAVAALLTLASVVLLRALAVRDRRDKVQRAFAAAMFSTPAADRGEAEAPSSFRAGNSVSNEATAAPFDGELHPGQDAPKPLNAADLRAAALAVAAAAGDDSSAAPAPKPSTTPWEPVEIPKPVYVDAAKAERPAPEPLELPEAPKASAKTSLRQAVAVEQQTAAPAKSSSALNNLDDVLQRRRA